MLQKIVHKNYFYNITIFVFQNAATITSNEDENETCSGSLILPDMEGKDFEIFLSFLWTYRYENQTALNKEDSLAAVLRAMDILCIDFKHSEHKKDSLRKNQSICNKSIETLETIHTKGFATPNISGTKPPKAQSESNKENRACMNVPRKTHDTKASNHPFGRASIVKDSIEDEMSTLKANGIMAILVSSICFLISICII